MGEIMLITLFRTLILYILIIFTMRVLGKRQIGELQPAELVITILLSEIIVIPMQDTEIPLINTLIPVFVLSGFEMLVSFIGMKSIKFRSVMQGNPVIVIRDGKLNAKKLKELRFTTDDLAEALRKKDIFDISEVQYAIVETDGTLSVLLKKENQPATKSELKINTPKSSLPCIVISDGRIIKTDFAECNTDSDKIKAILKDKHLNEEDVMLMTLDKDGNINILKKDKEKLKRSCIIISIVAFTILVIAAILKFSVFSNLPNKANETGSFTAYIILEILIWVSSGIGASAITLVLSKKYDYENKKKIAITDYYYDSQTLFFEIVKLKPLANDNWIEATKSFESFQSSYAVWKKMLHNRESMRLTKKDNAIKNLVDSIHNEFKTLLESIMVVNLYLNADPSNRIVRDSNKRIFKMELVNNDDVWSPDALIRYTPLAKIKILPLLGQLEKIVTGRKTMTEQDCPSYSSEHC